MIYILHGEDTTASYQRLRLFEKTNDYLIKVSFTKEDDLDKFNLAIWGENLFESPALIISKGLLTKINPKTFKNLPREKIIVFWEPTQLSAKILNPFKNIAKIENFKPQPQLYWFLDSLSPNSKKTLETFQKLDVVNSPVLWNISQRLLLLTLVKLNFSGEQIEKITGRRIEDWQLSKIKLQSEKFNLPNLKSFFSGSLKLDFALKSGLTSYDQKFLISVLLLKYLRI